MRGTKRRGMMSSNGNLGRVEIVAAGDCCCVVIPVKWVMRVVKSGSSRMINEKACGSHESRTGPGVVLTRSPPSLMCKVPRQPAVRRCPFPDAL